MLGSSDYSGVTVIADLEAGIGTMTRLADRAVDAVIVVVEPTTKSIDVGRRVCALARERSVDRIVVVANRITGDEDLRRLEEAFPTEHVVPVPHDRAIVDADRRGQAPVDFAPDAPAVRALVSLAEGLIEPARTAS